MNQHIQIPVLIVKLVLRLFKQQSFSGHLFSNSFKSSNWSKKSGKALYLGGWLVGWLVVRNARGLGMSKWFSLSLGMGKQWNNLGTHLGLFQDFLRTIWGLSEDFLRTVLGLSQDFLRTFWRLSAGVSKTSEDFFYDFLRTLVTFWGLSEKFLGTFWRFSGDFLRTFWVLS